MSVASVMFCQVEFSATDRSLVQRIPTGCGVSECEQVQQYPLHLQVADRIKTKSELLLLLLSLLLL